MKSKDIIILSIVLLSILAILLIVGFVYLLQGNYNIFNIQLDFSDSNMELVDTKEAQADSINNIDFKLYSADVELKKSENENIKVEIYTNKEKNIKVEAIENVFKIEELDEKKSKIVFNERKKVIVYVPESYLGEFNIVATSGDINSEIDAPGNKFNIVTTSGDIDLNSIGASSIVVTSGDIDINKANDGLKITTTSGDIKISKISKNVDINVTSGDINIDELDIKENSRIEAKSGDVTINNNVCNCYVEAETNSGDKSINKFDRKSEIELKIKTTSGDISVN